MLNIKSWLVCFATLTILSVSIANAQNNSGTKTQSESCSGNNASDLNLVHPGEFTFAASGELRPFSFMKNGHMVGADIAVGKAIAKQLGLKPNPQKANFAGILIGVEHHRYDAAVANHTITKAREKIVNFSTPYSYSGPAVFVRKDSNIKSVSDLKNKQIAVERSSTYVKMAEKYTDHVPQVNSDVVALQALAKGHYDAVITDVVTGGAAIKNGVQVKEIKRLGIAKLGIPVAKNNTALLHAINCALKTLRSNGKLKKASMKYVSVDIVNPPKNNFIPSS